MMARIRLCIVFLFLCIAVRSLSQVATTAVTGRVIDRTTQEPIEFAIVKFKGAPDGVVTDSMGTFAIHTPDPASNTVIASFVGYKPFELRVKVGQPSQITIQLASDNIELKEVLVKPKKHKRIIDTTALIIYHHVVDNKARNRLSNIPSYYYKEYTKIDYSLLDAPSKFLSGKFLRHFAFFKEKVDTADDGSPYITLFTQEELSEEYYSRHPERKRRLVHYKRLSGIKSPNVVKLLSYQFQTVDVYENVNILFLLSFMSPFSPGARIAYDYHVLDTAKIEGRTSYKLNFVGRNPNDLSYKGYAWIDSATWAIKQIYMKPNERANINFICDYGIEQTFEMVNDSSWIMVRENLKAEGNLLKSAKKYSVLIDKTTLRRNIKTDIRIPDSIIHIPDELVDPDAYKKKFSYMDTMRFDTLNPTERLVYHHFDTLHTVDKYKDLKWLYSLFTTANLKAGPIEFGRLYKAISRNAVEDYRLRMGVRTNYDFSSKMLLSAYGAYGTKDKAWKYEGDARFFLPTVYDRWHAIEFEYKRDMTILGQTNTFLTFDNITTLLSSTNELDQVIKTREVNITHEKDWFKGLSTVLTFQSRKFFSMPGAFNYSAYDYPTQTYIPHDFFTTEFGASIRYCKSDRYFDGYTYRYWIQTKAPTFTLFYNMGVKDLFQGDYAYYKLVFELDHRQQFPVIGHAVILLRAGYIFGDAPYPVAFMTPSNIGFIRDSYSFQLTQPFEFVTDKFLQVWYEHYFDGLLFNRLPYIKRFHLREFIMCKMLIGDFSAHNSSLMLLPAGMTTPSSVPYIEAGIGIENIFKVLQVNFIWRCTYRNTPGAPNFAFKLGIKPGF